MLMRKLYDFSDSTKNPYANRSKKQIAVRIDEDTIDYFKEMAETKGIPYQSLINLYLRDSAADNKELKTKWE
jgi:predicted DNA binding CopG/RHH family protein